MRLIDADGLKKLFTPGGTYRTKSVFHKIDALPTIDAVPVVHWRCGKTNNPSYSPFDGSQEHLSICSNCAYSREQHGFMYCPNCGAKMDLEEKPNGTDNS